MSQRETAMSLSPTTPSNTEHDPFSTPARFQIASTPGQIEIWLSEQLGGGAGLAYNEAFSIHLKGDVDEKALAQALQTLTDFHEALRGRFSADGLQFIIEASVTLPIARQDLSTFSEDRRSQELSRIVSQDSSTPFNLETGPLARATIIRLDASEMVVILSAHHAAVDGWSLDVLLADFGRLYSAFVGSVDLPTPPEHGFSDFVRYCLTPESIARIQTSRTFWQNEFNDVPPALSPACDGIRPPLRSYGANHAAISVPAAALAQRKAFARAENVSLFSVLISGYATLLHRLSGAMDLIVGIPIAGHPEAGMEDCVGHLVNMAPIRFDFSDKPGFRVLCRATNTKVLDARENAWVGFGEIVKDLKIARDPARVPLVPVTFTHVQKYAPGKISFGSCGVDYDLNPRASETFEVSLNAIESRDGLCFHAHANSDMYSHQWINWRLQELATLLLAGCKTAQEPVDRLPLLPPAETEFVLNSLSGTVADYPRDASLPALFEEQADRAPEGIALCFGTTVMTYGELEASANRLARALRQRGVGRGHLVGICIDRCPNMVVAMLAVLKAGAGYIPLDPGFPAGRLAFMVEDSKPALVVSESKLAALHGCPPSKSVELDKIADTLAQYSNERLSTGKPVDRSACGNDLAYVLYTSGSTGKPKGVCVHHRAAMNFLAGMAREPGLCAADRVLAVTTLSFDIAFLEIMLPLTVGARIVLATRDQAMDAEALRRLVEGEAVTLMQATPTMWRLLLASGWNGSSRLKARCGGEAMPPYLAQALAGKVGELWNMYGPTETTVWSTCGKFTGPHKAITIGRPIANTTIRIVDEHLQLCPVNVPGEICIGGDGVALGYLHQPELTAERFIPDLYAKSPGVHMYRTGDLGRLRSDGEIECLGRVDDQVKVRGYRIELGEIECVLAGHPTVLQVVVTAREDHSGDVRIVAYIKPCNGALNEGDLRAHLRQSVPDYMVPQHFVAVQSFPTTPNGKIDRKALPKPDFLDAATTMAPGPRTKTEEHLTGLWKKLLKRDSIGVDDDFFEIGGHSLLGVALSVELNNRMGLQLPLSQIIRTPTLSGLASAIDAMARTRECIDIDDNNFLIELRPGGSQQLFFVCDGLGEVLPYINLARRMPPQYGVHGILPRRLPRIPMAHRSVVDMAAHCVAEMRRKQPAGPYLIGGLCAGGVIAFAAAEQLEQQGQSVTNVVLLDAVAPGIVTRQMRRSPRRWVRFYLLQRLLRKGRNWPRWLPPLTVPEIYEIISSQYNPGCVQASLVLVRAKEGKDADTAAVDVVDDPLLGWGDRTVKPLRIFDAAGGHSSMLQEPNVASLAERLIALLEETAIADATASALDNKNDEKPEMPSGNSTSLHTFPPSPGNETETAMTRLWSAFFGLPAISATENFFDIGGDSLKIKRILLEINNTFNQTISTSDLLTYPTIKGISALIERKNRSGNRPTKEIALPMLFPVQVKGNNPPLFIVGGAHDNQDFDSEKQKSTYEEYFLRYLGQLISNIGTDQPIYAFRPKGLENEKPHRSVEEMASAYIQEMKKLQPQGPYLLAGNCLGGNVAYEMAQQLTAAGQKVSHVILMDTHCPSYAFYIKHKTNYLRWRAGVKRDNLIKGYKTGGMIVLIKLLKQYAKLLLILCTPLTPNLFIQRRLMLRSYKYRMICLKYRLKPYRGKITLFATEELRKQEPDLGWNSTLYPTLEIITIPGNHETRLTANGNVFGEKLREVIKRSVSSPSVILQ